MTANDTRYVLTVQEVVERDFPEFVAIVRSWLYDLMPKFRDLKVTVEYDTAEGWGSRGEILVRMDSSGDPVVGAHTRKIFHPVYLREEDFLRGLPDYLDEMHMRLVRTLRRQ